MKCGQSKQGPGEVPLRGEGMGQSQSNGERGYHWVCLLWILLLGPTVDPQKNRRERGGSGTKTVNATH